MQIFIMCGGFRPDAAILYEVVNFHFVSSKAHAMKVPIWVMQLKVQTGKRKV